MPSILDILREYDESEEKAGEYAEKLNQACRELDTSDISNIDKALEGITTEELGRLRKIINSLSSDTDPNKKDVLVALEKSINTILRKKESEDFAEMARTMKELTKDDLEPGASELEDSQEQNTEDKSIQAKEDLIAKIQKIQQAHEMAARTMRDTADKINRQKKRGSTQHISDAHYKIKGMLELYKAHIESELKKLGTRKKTTTKAAGGFGAGVLLKIPGNAEAFDALSNNLDVINQLQACFSGKSRLSADEKIDEILDFAIKMHEINATHKFPEVLHANWDGITQRAARYVDRAIGTGDFAEKSIAEKIGKSLWKKHEDAPSPPTEATKTPTSKRKA